MTLPSTGGFSETRLGHMHDVMAGYVQRGEVPGLVFAVSRRGETYVDAIGIKAVDSGDPVERDTIFRISSMTKPITAAATMILVEDCKLRLDDPVDELLPELADPTVLKRLDGPIDDTVPAKRPITLRDLLTFRLGSGGLFVENPDDYPILVALGEAKLGAGPPAPALPPEPDEWMRRFGRLPLMYQPGEKWQYHTGAEILGVLVARASGQPFETFTRERIFDPLGMKDTSFSVPEEKLDRFTPCYMPNNETKALDVYDDVRGQWSSPPAFESGGAGLVSTVDDYLAFGRTMLGNGRYDGGRILSRASIALMTTNHVTAGQRQGSELLLPDPFGWGFGMGVIARRESVFSVGSYGWDGGMGSSWRSDPNEQLVGTLMTNTTWTSPSPPGVVRDFWTSAYAAIDD